VVGGFGADGIACTVAAGGDADCVGLGLAGTDWACLDAGRSLAVREAGRGDGAVATAASGVRATGCCAVVVGAGACSAGLVLVPGRLKFCSSRGPIASVAGVLVVAGSVVFWASAAAGRISSPPASNIVSKRKPALISSRSVPESPFHLSRRVRLMPAASTLFKHSFDEPHRTQGF